MPWKLVLVPVLVPVMVMVLVPVPMLVLQLLELLQRIVVVVKLDWW